MSALSNQASASAGEERATKDYVHAAGRQHVRTEGVVFGVKEEDIDQLAQLAVVVIRSAHIRLLFEWLAE